VFVKFSLQRFSEAVFFPKNTEIQAEAHSRKIVNKQTFLFYMKIKSASYSSRISNSMKFCQEVLEFCHAYGRTVGLREINRRSAGL
jgi:hypothetical protein